MSQINDNQHDTLPPSMDPAAGTEVEPPKDFFGILKRLGPGLIIAGSIVGSGELIATTKTGAQAGITLLWLIIIGCVIKVFVQIELGRFTISHGETTLAALNRVPGPRFLANWIVWFWLIMMLVGLGQVGGIVGGVGQALAIAFPFNGDYAEAVRVPSERELKRYVGWKLDMQSENPRFVQLSSADQNRVRRGQELLEGKLKELNESPPQFARQILAERRDNASSMIQPGSQFGEVVVNAARALVLAERAAHEAVGIDVDEATLERLMALSGQSPEDFAGLDGKQLHLALHAEIVRQREGFISRLTQPATYDDKFWAGIVTLVTIVVLFRGRYGLIQNFSTVLVVTFTFLTVGNVIALQYQPEFHLKLSEILSGLLFNLPDATPPPPGVYGLDTKNPLATALSAFGIIGVGASELVSYPYWCLEKGYAKYTGPRSSDPGWAKRARGWMSVMHYDAFMSMIVYTIATLAFFLMGVAVMYKQGLDPEGMRMTSTLLEQYVPVFGQYASWLFLGGAIAVLYSTFLVANAGYGRMYTDALKVYGLLDPHNQKAHDRWVVVFTTVLPLISLTIYCSGFEPDKLVLLGGTMQALMLPLLGLAALYLRFKLTDSRLKPSRFWDGLLILSCIGLAISGGWKLYGVFT